MRVASRPAMKDIPLPAVTRLAEGAVPAAPRPGDTYVQSFARGLAVIRSFSAQAPSQSLSEVASRTGLTRAGARRILLTLEGLGYVESQGRQFRLTPKILDLGLPISRRCRCGTSRSR
jgi:IclR family pca regulon transcriptional regulator